MEDGIGWDLDYFCEAELYNCENKMQKIEFKVEFLEIVYKVKPKKSFPVRLTVETEEGIEVRREEVVIPAEDSRVKIADLTPFEFVFIAIEDRTFYLPHNLYFIVDRTPLIRRRIPLQLSNIYDQHLVRPFQKEMAPLERIYTFQEGKIIYNVRIVRSGRVTDEEEVQRYELKLGQFSSLSSSRIKESLSQSRVSRGEENSKRERPKPSFFIEDIADKLQGQETMDLEDPESSEKGEGGLSYLQSWQEFSQMEEEHRQEQLKSANFTQVKKQVRSHGFALKFILALVVVGFLLLVFDARKDPIQKVKVEGNRKKKREEGNSRIGRKEKQRLKK